MVPKKDKSWRLCVDFKDLNKACPKDPFPLPRIDQIIDATAGHDLLCFLDAYSGYHQIKMAESDQAVTAFITPYGPFCFNTMPFGLKKRRRNISAHDPDMSGKSDRQNSGGVC